MTDYKKLNMKFKNIEKLKILVKIHHQIFLFKIKINNQHNHCKQFHQKLIISSNHRRIIYNKIME